ncbi:protein EARLY RESPONSIVE TO DEHYDRATION 15-like [Curcuma longa]|uniref:protein EARLY RESPONSIVE TO DEHYDRATION 15-like n=1 Tax=Curcuma longa TaxID=136217 RepID=UPI003D9F77A0
MDVEEISASSATARARSVLNPDAAPYVPASQRSVEDFSPEWWALVQFSPRFVHYWLRECFHDEGEIEDHDLPDDISDALLSFSTALDREEKNSGGWRREVAVWGAEKWKASLLGCAAEGARYAAKAAKVVNMKKMSPRMIQQPR